jgi:hypothetical protein
MFGPNRHILPAGAEANHSATIVTLDVVACLK